MMARCYGGKDKNYHDCSVSEDWHSFENYFKWYNLNYFKGGEVDKDIKIKGNRIYSENTCMMVPKLINNIVITNKSTRKNFIGVVKSYNKFVANLGNVYLGIFESAEEAFNCFKKHKENDVKDVALLFYSNGLITLECYEALNNWKIELND